MADFNLKRGFDIKIAGKAELRYKEVAPPQRVALQPVDFKGMKARLEVEEGSQVKKGSPLFHDKARPEVKFTSPVSGKVVAINRGERRKITEVIIESDGKNDEITFPAVTADKLDGVSADDIKNTLLESGMWPMIIQRPFGKIADPSAKPRDIFISAMDTSPLASDVNFIMDGLEKEFQFGVDILQKLTEGKVHLGVDGHDKSPAPAFAQINNVVKNSFSGPHPAGNVGIQIHHVAPIRRGDIIWTVKPYFVAMIGKLFSTGKIPTERIISIAGNGIREHVYFKTMVGAPISLFVNEDNIAHGDVRAISGDVLTGVKKQLNGFVGFYDNLLSVIPEGPKEKKLVGWFRPGGDVASYSRTFLSRWLPKSGFEVSTLKNGSDRAFVLSGLYEEVLPMDIYPVYLMKSIMADDIEEMEGLGILELVEEDIALCSYICPSKYDFGGILREGLDLIEKEG